MPRKKSSQSQDGFDMQVIETTNPYPRVEKAYPKAQEIDKGPNNNYDLSDLYSPGAKYSAEEKIAAVTAYVMTGTISGAVRLTGFKQQVISDWKNNSSWWPDLYQQVKNNKQEEIDGALTTIIHAASGEVLDRLVNGDEVVDKNGEKVRKKINGRDLAWILGVLYDKRALLRGDPTSRSEKVDSTKIMSDLKEEFAKMAHDALNIKVINPEID